MQFYPDLATFRVASDVRLTPHGSRKHGLGYLELSLALEDEDELPQSGGLLLLGRYNLARPGAPHMDINHGNTQIETNQLCQRLSGSIWGVVFHGGMIPMSEDASLRAGV